MKNFEERKPIKSWCKWFTNAWNPSPRKTKWHPPTLFAYSHWVEVTKDQKTPLPVPMLTQPTPEAGCLVYGLKLRILLDPGEVPPCPLPCVASSQFSARLQPGHAADQLHANTDNIQTQTKHKLNLKLKHKDKLKHKHQHIHIHKQKYKHKHKHKTRTCHKHIQQKKIK